MTQKRLIVFNPLDPDNYGNVQNDDVSIEVLGSSLQVKDSGITEAKLNALSVAQGKIALAAVGEAQIDLTTVDAQSFLATYGAANYTPAQVGSEGTDKVSSHFKGIDSEINTLNIALSALNTGQRFKGAAFACSGDAALLAAADATALSTLLPFSDDDLPSQLAIGDFAAGQLVLAITPASSKIFEIYDDAATLRIQEVVAAPILSDTYYVKNDLVDNPDTQENSAFYTFNDVTFVKTGDVDFQFADGIDLNSGYASSGDSTVLPQAADSVQVAIGKIQSGAMDADSITKRIMNADVAGVSLSQAAGGEFDVNVDDSSIEVTTDSLNVKALGITDAMLAGSISDAKLTEDYIISSEVDDASIEFNGGTLNVKALGVAASMLAADSVITAKILDLNVTEAKLSTDLQNKINSAVASTVAGIAGESLVTNQLVYLSNADNKSYKALADAIANCDGKLYVVKTGGALDAAIELYESGIIDGVNMAGVEIFDSTKPFFLSNLEAGKMTHIAPVTGVIAHLGYASTDGANWSFDQTKKLIL